MGYFEIWSGVEEEVLWRRGEGVVSRIGGLLGELVIMEIRRRIYVKKEGVVNCLRYCLVLLIVVSRFLGIW